MSDDPNQAEVNERLARLEAGGGGSPVTAQRRSPLVALLVVALIGLAGLLIAVPLAAVIGVLGRFGVSQYKDGRLYGGPADSRTLHSKDAAE